MKGKKAIKKKREAKEKKARGEKVKPQKTKQELQQEKAGQGLREKRRHEKQILFILGLMTLIIAGFFIFFFIYKNIGNFVYEGIKFQKTTLGDSRIPLYHGVMFIMKPSGTVKFNLYFRNDPRNLENISVNFSTPTLRPYGYISFQPAISGCFGSSYASFRLAEFLSALGMNVKGATTDPILSQQSDNKIEWRNCDDARKYNLTIVMLQQSTTNDTMIQQEGNCYIMNISHCEIIPASEKFILETALALKGR